MHIMEHWFPESEIAIYKYPKESLLNLPQYFRDRCVSFESYEEIVDKPCIIFLDDTALFLLSRSTARDENKDWVMQMTISRHNDHRIISTAQNTILVDKGIYESLDQYALRCKMSYMQSMTERDTSAELQLRINELFDDLAVGKPDIWARGLRYCPETDEIFHFPPVPWFTDDVSKPFKGCYVSGGEICRISRTAS